MLLNRGKYGSNRGYSFTLILKFVRKANRLRNEDAKSNNEGNDMLKCLCVYLIYDKYKYFSDIHSPLTGPILCNIYTVHLQILKKLF